MLYYNDSRYDNSLSVFRRLRVAVLFLDEAANPAINPATVTVPP